MRQTRTLLDHFGKLWSFFLLKANKRVEGKAAKSLKTGSKSKSVSVSSSKKRKPYDSTGEGPDDEEFEPEEKKLTIKGGLGR